MIALFPLKMILPFKRWLSFSIPAINWLLVYSYEIFPEIVTQIFSIVPWVNHHHHHHLSRSCHCWQMASTTRAMHFDPGPFSSIDCQRLPRCHLSISFWVFLLVVFHLWVSTLMLFSPTWCSSFWLHVLPTVLSCTSLFLLYLGLIQYRNAESGSKQWASWVPLCALSTIFTIRYEKELKGVTA